MQANQKEFLQFCGAKSFVEEKLYIQLYQEFLENLKSENNPVLIVFAGAPGAGKTTWRKMLFANKTNAHVHDMDEVLIRLPEYQENLKLLGSVKAFEICWPTAKKIADLLVQYAIRQKYSILYDRTCGAEESYFDLLKAKKLGYKIYLNGFCIEPDIAFSRIAIREKEINRAITSEIFEEYRARFSALWPYYLNFVDAADLYDTSGDTPRKIFSLQEGIKDPSRYNAFLNEGKSFCGFFSQKIQNKYKEK